jgi:hypothetical protein
LNESVNEFTRPKGLTLLGLTNFTLGGVGILSFFQFVVPSVLQDISAGQFNVNRPDLPAVQVLDVYVVSAVVPVLMICAGIGYWKMRRGLGLVVGNILCACLFLNSILLSVINSQTPQMIGALYYVPYLYFINFKYKRFFK